MKALDPFSINLEKTTLIEASAGTGKTYTITTLYCRLVATGYPVESILVVTFTEAAAAELKIRIRQRLVHALDSLQYSKPEEADELVRAMQKSEDKKQMILRLKAAVTSFDQASVMTIHSFCLKALKENAFESRSLFDIQLVPDRSVFLNQVVCDYFMSKVNILDPLFLSFLAHRNFTPESLTRSFSNIIARQDLCVTPDIKGFKNRFEEYRTVAEKAFQVLGKEKETIQDLIQSHDGINKRSYSKKNLPKWLDQTLSQMEQDSDTFLFKIKEKGDPIYRFTRTCLTANTKDGKTPPEHLFFDLCQTLLEIYQSFERNLIYLKIGFLNYYNQQLDKMKSSQGVCFFDDLVNDLAKGLAGPSGDRLKKEIRYTFKACLIDEFQDTDPSQYMIFSTLFATAQTPFFMVGDPKQAIYAFRGGDIFAYLQASRESEQQATLMNNYRSAPLLVQGVNALFSYPDDPFLFKEIQFTEVGTPATAQDRLIEKDRPVPPVEFCFIERRGRTLDKQGMIPKENARQAIPGLVAQDIITLLSSDSKLAAGQDLKQITPGDIAVLVRTNAQAAKIQKALSDWGIRSYQSSTGSVYDTQQAVELHDILWAVQHPEQLPFVKAALATSAFGFTAADMIRLEENESDLYHFQNLFFEYKQEWKEQGFVTMMNHLFHSKDAFLKSHDRSGGKPLNERAMTNFYHLVELISQALVTKDLSVRHLFKWYVDQLSPELRDEAADQLRLESDKQAVAIVTIHKSKGLEYPIVYLPYLWEGGPSFHSDQALFHDPENSFTLTLDLGSNNQSDAKAYAAMENTAEQRRLLYVALTRASALCKIFWGGFQSVDQSALGAIMNLTQVKEDDTIKDNIAELVEKVPQSIRIKTLAGNTGLEKYQQESTDTISFESASVQRKVDPVWSISSFSAITQGLAYEHKENPGSDENDTGVTGPLHSPIVLKDFPKGALAGDFFHSVFETLDFTDSGRVDALTREKAGVFGFFEKEGLDCAVRTVQDVLATPLKAGANKIRLDSIPSDDRFNELEFTFNVDHFNMSAVKTALKMSDSDFIDQGYIKTLDSLSSRSFKGFIKGFIDLIIRVDGKWYILDYKTNFLGDRYADYGSKDLFESMMEHHYFLQYHIYLVAFHRYLTRRLKSEYRYDRDFGGVFYLFIRGMKPEFESNAGVYFHKPPFEAIQYLSDHV